MSAIDLRYVKHFERDGRPVLSAELRTHSKHTVREMPVLFQVGLDGHFDWVGGEISTWITLLRRQVTILTTWRWRKDSWCWKKAHQQRVVPHKEGNDVLNAEMMHLLVSGKTIRFTAHGNSMTPVLKDRAWVTVEPCKLSDLRVGDIAFCKVRGNFYLHYVKAIGTDGRVQIGNAHGHINGWTRSVYGKLIDHKNP